MLASRLPLLGLFLVPFACSGAPGDNAPSDESDGGESQDDDEPDGTGDGGSGTTSSGGAAGDGGASGGGGANGGSGGTELAYGSVDLVPYYEEGSAWTSNSTARAMVETLFSEIEATLTTSGEWDATIEVYLTDDNPGTANTYFDTEYLKTSVSGKTVLVVSPWAEIVLGTSDPNGPADNVGSGYDFAISFNVAGQASNAGLLRHEVMHGLGAVNFLPNMTMSESDVPEGLVPGTWATASLYDLRLVDKNGVPLLGAYDETSEKFQINDFAVEPTFSEWTDGANGFAFRGVADDASNYDMFLGTFPGTNGAVVRLNEPSDLMSAGVHPSWDHLAEPDRAFFRALGYRLKP